MKKSTTIICLGYIVSSLLVFFILEVEAKRIHPERWYQEKWCREQQGKVEVRLPDGTRCDCLTATHAIEVDFSSKWAEGIGQSLYYASQTGKRAGILLIIESYKDRKYLKRVNAVIQYYNLPLDVWSISP